MRWLWWLLPFAVMWADFYLWLEVMSGATLFDWWYFPAVATSIMALFASFFPPISQI